MDDVTVSASLTFDDGTTFKGLFIHCEDTPPGSILLGKFSSWRSQEIINKGDQAVLNLYIGKYRVYLGRTEYKELLTVSSIAS